MGRLSAPPRNLGASRQNEKGFQWQHSETCDFYVCVCVTLLSVELAVV